MPIPHKDEQSLIRIKEILFGEELSELDLKLAELRADLEQLTENNKAEFQQKFTEMLDNLQKKEKAYHEKLKAQEKYFMDLHQQIKEDMEHKIDHLQKTMLSRQDTLEMLEYLSNKIKAQAD